MFLTHAATMWLLLLTFWLTVICCNLYVGYVQIHLFHKGLLHGRWNIGSSILRAALESATDRRDIRMINRAMVIFKISLGAFVSFILGILCMAV